VNVLQSRQQAPPQVALANSDKLAPIEPVYMKPEKASAISAHMQIPSEPVNWKAPVVRRAQRHVGMRYLLAHGALKVPLSTVGKPGKTSGVYSSGFQPLLVGPLHDAGFNDALFQAGYPGYNLGLSFKVPVLQENATGGPGFNMRMNVIPRFVKVQRINRPNTGPQYYNTQSVGG
jgi:hypothetical protein